MRRAGPAARFAAASIALATSIASFGASPPQVDEQVWSELDLSRALSSEVTATAILTTRLGDSLPNPTLTAGGLQLDFRTGAWTLTSTAYYVAVRSPQSGTRLDLWLPAAAVTGQVAWGPVTLSDRNRLEQLEGLPGAPVRYRNRGALSWQLPGRGPRTELFLSDEGFYDFATARWSRNRATVGVAQPLGPQARVQLFLLRQDSSTGTPRSLNVLGVTLQLAIA